MAFDPLELLKSRPAEAETESAVPLGGTRAERVQRLQIGLFGIFAIVLMIALADLVSDRIALTEATAVPEAAPTTEPSDTVTTRDPLVDAGVAPELPVDTNSEATPAPARSRDIEPPTQNAPSQ